MNLPTYSPTLDGQDAGQISQVDVLYSASHVECIALPQQTSLPTGELCILRYHISRPTLHANTNGDVAISCPFLTINQGEQVHIALTPDLVIERQGESYLIPNTSGQPSDVSFFRLSFPESRVTQAERDLFEQCLAYYATFALGPSMHNTLALVHRQTGEVVGIVQQDLQVPPEELTKDHSDAPIILQTDPSKTSTFRAVAWADTLTQQSDRLSSSMVQSATQWSQKMAEMTQLMKQKLKRNETPVTVSTSLRKNVKDVRGYTQAASKATTHVASFVVGAAAQFGNYMGHLLGGEADKSSTSWRGQTRYVLGQTLLAVSTLMDGVETSLKVLAVQGGKATVELVRHKYGDEMAGFIGDVTDVSGDLGLIYFDARGMRRKALVKVLAKNVAGHNTTGKEVKPPALPHRS